MRHGLTNLLSRSAGFLLLAIAPAYSFTFTEWQAENFIPAELADPAISGPNVDPDFDSYVNLAEYAHGLTPAVSESVAMTINLGPNGFSLVYPQRLGTTDLFYRVEESSDLVTWRWLTPNDASLITLSSNATTRTVSFLSPNASASDSKWFMRVRSYLTASGTDELLAPTGLAAALTVPFTVTLRWNDNAKIENAFLIERREGELGEWQLHDIAELDTNRLEDWDILGSKTYFYRVRSEDSNGDSSAPSNEVSITTPLDSDQDGIPDDREASFGTDPALFSTGNNNVPDGWWIRYALSPQTSFTFDSDGDGRSDVEEYFDGTNPTVTDSAPQPGSIAQPPTDLALETNSPTSHFIQWTNHSPDARRLSVERSEDGGEWARVATLPPNATTYTDASALADAVHFYRIVVHP